MILCLPAEVIKSPQIASTNDPMQPALLDFSLWCSEATQELHKLTRNHITRYNAWWRTFIRTFYVGEVQKYIELRGIARNGQRREFWGCGSAVDTHPTFCLNFGNNKNPRIAKSRSEVKMAIRHISTYHTLLNCCNDQFWEELLK